MDFHQWLRTIDKACDYIELLEAKIKSLEAELATKDLRLQQQNELVTSLKQQLETASMAMFANDTELTQLQDKMNHLSSMVLSTDT